MLSLLRVDSRLRRRPDPLFVNARTRRTADKGSHQPLSNNTVAVSSLHELVRPFL